LLRLLQHRGRRGAPGGGRPPGARGIRLMDLKELYRDVILDHKRQPRNFGRLESVGAGGDVWHADGHNPLCGDRLSVYVRMNGERVEDIRFEGSGCAISTASASLMTEAVKGK